MRHFGNGKPEPHFYLCKMSAPLLQRLSGVKRRDPSGPRAADLGIQRGHDVTRSRMIGRFIEAGYPWASLNTDQGDKFRNLRKPGWLPTAVVGNIVGASTDRNGTTVAPRDLVTIDTSGDDLTSLVLPEGSSEPTWCHTENCLEPIEIIDGQHRLYAFERDGEVDGHFGIASGVVLRSRHQLAGLPFLVDQRYTHADQPIHGVRFVPRCFGLLIGWNRSKDR